MYARIYTNGSTKPIFCSGGAESEPTQVEETQKAEPEEAPTKEAPREEAKAEESSTEVLSENAKTEKEEKPVEEKPEVKEEEHKGRKKVTPEDTQPDQGKGNELENGAPTKDNDDLQVGDKIKTVDVREPQENEDNEMILELQLEIEKKDRGNGDLVGPNDNLFENEVGMIENPRDTEFAKKLEFEIYDENNNLIRTTKGEIGPKNRWKRFLYVKGLQKDKKYKIKVKSDTVPEGYTYWFHTQEPHKRRPAFQISDDEDKKNSTAIMDSNGSTEKYGFGVLRLGVFDIIFAKDEETAKKIYTFDEGNNNITGFNPDLEYGKDYVKSRVTKDHKINKPSDFHKEGFKPLYWYTETLDEEGQEKELKIDDDFELKGELRTDERIWLSNKHINNDAVVFKGRSYILKLKSTLPLVKFNKNDGTSNPKVIDQNIYYLKSLATNEISTGKIPNNVVTPTREGYVFKGWNTQADGKGKAFDENTTVTDDLLGKDGKFTVYAQWEKVSDKPVDPQVKPSDDKPSGPIYTPSDDYRPSTPIVDIDEDDDGIRELIEEFDKLNKETPDNNSIERPEETPSEKEEKPKDENKENKEEMTNPTKSKDQKGNKVRNSGMKANPKTGVTGSAAVAALGLSSLFASLGLRKKND